jgi:hypothetical protein
MIKRSKNNLKWSIIVIASILTLTTMFSGNLYCLAGVIPLFWIYVILDKFKHFTKRAQIHKLYKHEKVQDGTEE